MSSRKLKREKKLVAIAVTALASNKNIKQIGPSSHDGGPNVCVGDFLGVNLVVL